MQNRMFQTRNIILNIILNIIKKADYFLYTFGNKIL